MRLILLLLFVELSCLQAKIAIFMLKSTPITSKNGQGYFFLNLTKTLLRYIQCISLVPMRLIFAKLSCLQAIDVMTLKDWSRSSIFKLNQDTPEIHPWYKFGPNATNIY